MTPLELVSILGILYSLLYIVDTFLRTNPSTSLRYLLKLRRLGLELSLFQIKYSTTRYNSGLQIMAGLRPGLTRAWFSLGAVVSVLLMPASLVLLTLSLWQHLRSVSSLLSSSGSAQALRLSKAHSGSYSGSLRLTQALTQ